MSTIPKHQLRVSNCTWLDVNSQFSVGIQPELWSDKESVLYISFFNLMNCPIGARGRIFQPEYGSSLQWFIHEPITGETAQKIRMSIMQTFERWEPRFKLDYRTTTITPDMNLPGYRVRLSGTYYIGKEYASIEFGLKQ